MVQIMQISTAKFTKLPQPVLTWRYTLENPMAIKSVITGKYLLVPCLPYKHTQHSKGTIHLLESPVIRLTLAFAVLMLYAQENLGGGL
jgi:hypothetical protein